MPTSESPILVDKFRGVHAARCTGHRTTLLIQQFSPWHFVSCILSIQLLASMNPLPCMSCITIEIYCALILVSGWPGHLFILYELGGRSSFSAAFGPSWFSHCLMTFGSCCPSPSGIVKGCPGQIGELRRPGTRPLEAVPCAPSGRYRWCMAPAQG